jgi:preprotein translocase subunit SecA
MLENWIFDSDDFINILNNALYETNKEIKHELNIKLLEYTTLIENELNEFFDNIENIISNLFTTQIKDFTSSQKDNINNIVSELINEFEIKMKSEAERIERNRGAYDLNINNISNYIINYKEKINTRINNSFFEEIDIFYENIYKNIYFDLVDKETNNYLIKVNNLTSSFNLSEYKLLNSSFKIGEIIYNLVEDIIGNYKLITLKTLYIKYCEYYEKISSSVYLRSINFNIEFNLDNIYQTVLLPQLNEENNCNLTRCPEFDFTQETKDDLEDIISEKINNIKKEISLIKGDNFLQYSFIREVFNFPTSERNANA